VVGEHNLADLRGDTLAAHRRATVGFVFQHFGLLDRLSARENIELAAALAARRMDRRPLTLALLDEVGLSARAEHPAQRAQRWRAPEGRDRESAGQ
jgi:putative ABC transport system ATP-binding protein